MKRGLAAVLCLCSTSALAQAPAPVIPYDAVDPLKLPDDLHLGEVAGVSVNSRGHIFVFSRGNTDGPAYGGRAAQLLEFDAGGNYLREVGKNLYAWGFAHTVKVDRDDNVWATDKGSDMVVKFNPQGRVTMVFGRKQEASERATAGLEKPNPPLPPIDGYFRQVTDVAWDSQGNAYISDGYINSRIAKLDRNGKWLMSFGEPGAGPGQLNTPHAIAVDAQNNVYVADRGNGRIQVFDGNGRFLRQMRFNLPLPPDARPAIGNQPRPTANGYDAPPQQWPGSPWTICITPGPNQVIYTSDAYPGRIYKMSLDGKLLGVLGEAGKQMKQFGWIHEIACPSENELYVAEVLNWRVQKLTLRPERTAAARP
jgi:DNA-binding beta-propeller fold protein YncE